jgi:hypothetical protein
MTAPALPDIPQGLSQAMWEFCAALANAFRYLITASEAEQVEAVELVNSIAYAVIPKDHDRDIKNLEKEFFAQPAPKSYERRISELEARLDALASPIKPGPTFDLGLYNPSFPSIDVDKLNGIDEGAEVNEINGDGTAGRVLRTMVLGIYDGTDAATLECQTITFWNGDADGPTDNVAKGATTGNYTLDGAGVVLTIEAAALAGNCIMAFGMIGLNITGAAGLTAYVHNGANDIKIEIYNESGIAQDITTLVDSGTIKIMILYLTAG